MQKKVGVLETQPTRSSPCACLANELAYNSATSAPIPDMVAFVPLATQKNTSYGVVSGYAGLYCPYSQIFNSNHAGQFVSKGALMSATISAYSLSDRPKWFRETLNNSISNRNCPNIFGKLRGFLPGISLFSAVFASFPVFRTQLGCLNPTTIGGQAPDWQSRTGRTVGRCS